MVATEDARPGHPLPTLFVRPFSDRNLVVDSVGVSPDHPHPLGRRLAAPSPVPLAGHIIGFAVRVDKTGTVRSLLLPWTVPC